MSPSAWRRLAVAAAVSVPGCVLIVFGGAWAVLAGLIWLLVVHVRALDSAAHPRLWETLMQALLMAWLAWLLRSV